MTVNVNVNELAQKIAWADKAYYSSGHPIMTDEEYDGLKDLLKSNDPDHPLFAKIGDIPSELWEKATHQIAMGSLNKVNTSAEFKDWAAKFIDENFILEPKMDGLSLSIDYQDGVFVRAITRGDGVTGEDISVNVRKMIGFIEKMAAAYTGSVRCEIILPFEALNRINSILSEEDRYLNCRNAAAGISRGLNGQFCQYLHLIYYDILIEKDECAKICTLRENSFKTVVYSMGDINDMISAFEELRKAREKLPYKIDGAVIKVNSYEVQTQAGILNGRPKGQIAWKFEPPGASAHLREVTPEVGRTGVITPLGHIDPVEVDGSVIKKVTLHNYQEIARLGIGLGDLVMLIKAGDVIPKVSSVIESKGKAIPVPTKCPVCQTPLTGDLARLYCPSNICPAKNHYRILNWIKVTGIENFGEATLNILEEKGVINCIKDIYKLPVAGIAMLPGYGEKSAHKIVSNINSARILDLPVFLSALGIPGLSTKTAQDLVDNFKSLDNILAAKVEDIIKIHGYSDISAEQIVSGLTKFREEITSLLQVIKMGSKENQPAGVLSGMSFCFTGAMTKPRSYYQKLVTANGGKNDSGVTKSTTYLVCNEDYGSTKSKRATELGVKIINEQAFIDMVGIKPEPSNQVTTESVF